MVPFRVSVKALGVDNRSGQVGSASASKGCSGRMRSPTISSIVPPYIFEFMAISDDPETRRVAIENIRVAAESRALRTASQRTPLPPRPNGPPGEKRREVYDLQHSQSSPVLLPGTLRRSEGSGPVGDDAVDDVYDLAGTAYDFYFTVLERHSIDGAGRPLEITVHAGLNIQNAFWNGRQLIYGDGNGVFSDFTKSLDVIGHELTHAVVQHSCNLNYWGQSGSLNEHLCDVFGTLVKQWHLDQDAAQASWLVGDEILAPSQTRRALRSMNEPGTAFENDPVLGSDPQPSHMNDFYTGPWDDGGVHINSGIPNRAFFLVASRLEGKAWERAGRIWYDAMIALQPGSQFADMVVQTEACAEQRFGKYSAEHQAVCEAWRAVGL